MQETYYFGAGPATLPKSVLNKIALELIDYRGTGLSVLELSHRSDAFLDILDNSEHLLREIMAIPDSHAVLFLHGGATAQYSMLPVNFLGDDERADYICTGQWSLKASQEAKKFAAINSINALDNTNEISVKPLDQWHLDKHAKYIHYCDNETINGVANDLAGMEYFKSNQADLFCDMTSSILTRPIQVQDYALIYASAQKNLGVAGLCVMIVKKDLLKSTKHDIPRIYDYRNCFENRSMVNTPPIFSIYVLSLMLSWLKQEGGVSKFFKHRKQHAKDVYKVIDESVIYKNKVSSNDRSCINIPFRIKDKSLETEFLQHAEANKLLGLKGHKSIGGLRISLYNALPKEGVEALLGFMQKFA